MQGENGQSWTTRGRALAGKAWVALPVSAAVVVVLLAVVGEVAQWRRAAKEDAAPVVAATTKRLDDVPRVPVAAELNVPALPKGKLGKIQDTYRAPVATVDRSGEVVDASGKAIPGGFAGAEVALEEVTLPRLPEGGSALVTRTASGDVSVHIAPKPRRFFELSPVWAVGALVSPLDTARSRVYVRFDGLRLGRVHVVGEAGQEWRAGSAGAYAMVGAELRFGER
ncbi:MAG: hypothetical protein IPQ07_40020 [Myxococcales bacterium]|nr:hypothetical protein [Myxococcales bacterium]